MFELLQYTPNTATVRQRPLLMVPPQVNKFYVADLAPGRSLVEYAVAQGVQVFMIVWRNPRKGTTHGRWGLADYVSAQVRALDVVREITRSDQVNMLGVCAGGLTTAVTLGYLAAVGDADVGSATFLVTMLASTHPNAVGMMATQGGVDKVRHNAAQGTVIDGETLGRNFALLRLNDLVFGYVTNNWLLGNNPPAFDILAWNADTANLSSAFQRDTLDVLVNNKLMQPGAVRVLGTPVDLAKVDIDTFMAAGHRDHIAPWDGCYMTSQLFGGSTEVVIAATGHIQTLVNPIQKSRYSYWTGLQGDPDPYTWLAGAAKHEGSWWPRWAEWSPRPVGRGDQRSPAAWQSRPPRRRRGAGPVRARGLGRWAAAVPSRASRSLSETCGLSRWTFCVMFDRGRTGGAQAVSVLPPADAYPVVL
jgi:polyhydroxyalkanoate synthase